MKVKVFGVVCCLLLIATVVPVSAQTTPVSTVGTRGFYASRAPIISPDGAEYRAIMFCLNHKQTMGWVTGINESGFQKTWRQHAGKLGVLYMIPGVVLWFGLDDFCFDSIGLVLLRQHQADFEQFLQGYDTVNGQGMVLYLWQSRSVPRPVAFGAQPDNTWVEDSWVLQDGTFIPNPDVWVEL